MSGAEQHKLKKYLLGQLTEAEEEQVELRLLTDSECANEYDIIVDEITDDYIAGHFEGEDLKQVKDHFFKSAARRKKLRFALALKQRRSELAANKGKKNWFKPYLLIAATLVLVAGGFYIWRTLSYQAQLNEGLAALHSAFREERPLEVRLSDFPYAPLANQRGGPAKIDYVQRDRAASLLLNSISEHRSAASHHALGQYYLAEREFDKAIEQFQIAVRLDPDNAKTHSDLGAAWLELGKTDREGRDPVKGMDELVHSLDQLNKSLALNPNLPDAVFNRALCHEYLTKLKEAAEDWRRYLQLDTASPWAIEANRHLVILEKSFPQRI